MAPRKPTTIKEFTSSDGQSVAPEPVETGSSARPADKQDGEKAIPASRSELLSAAMQLMSGFPTTQLGDIYRGLTDTIKPGQGHAGRAADQAKGELGIIVTSPTAVGGMKEDVAEIFRGENLSEELIEKAQTIFEAAVNARVVVERTAIQEQAETLLEERLAEALEGVAESVDRYLTYAAKEFVSENKLALESGVRSEIAETFLKGLRDLFVESYIEIPEDKTDVVAEMAARIDELEAKYNSAVEETMTVRESVKKHEADRVIAEAAEGLTKIDAERLSTLVEGVTWDSVDQLKQKVSVIKESYFKQAPAPKKSVTEVLTEATDLPDEVQEVPSHMKMYHDIIARTTHRTV